MPYLNWMRNYVKRECEYRDDMVNSLFFTHRLQGWVSFHDGNIDCQLNVQRFVLVVVGVISILSKNFNGLWYKWIISKVGIDSGTSGECIMESLNHVRIGCQDRQPLWSEGGDSGGRTSWICGGHIDDRRGWELAIFSNGFEGVERWIERWVNDWN